MAFEWKLERKMREQTVLKTRIEKRASAKSLGQN